LGGLPEVVLTKHSLRGNPNGSKKFVFDFNGDKFEQEISGNGKGISGSIPVN
jgi:hypothetical protein